MSSYNELLALIDAYINQNGVQAITGQVLNGVLRAMVDQLGRGYAIMGAALPNTDPGTPDAPESWFASTPGTYTNFDGLTVANAELALLSYSPTDQAWTKQTLTQGIVSTSASVDNNVGTPSVTSSYVNGVLTFTFQNLKGNPGQDGDAAGFGTVSATVDGNVGTPGVSVQTSGPNTAKNMVFQFTNLKGETGVTSVVATVDNTSGSPQCAVSLSGGVLTLAFTGLKGAQGDTGSSVAYPFTIVNNLTTNDATQALSAAMGVQLESEVTQLEHIVTNLAGKFYGVFDDDSELPEGNIVGYAFVGTAEPLALFTFDGEDWTDTEVAISGIIGPPGPQGIQGIQGIQGPPGVTGAEATIDAGTGTPSVEVTLTNGVLTFAFHNLKGLQGNTGSSVSYPFTLVNNTTTDDATQALTAAVGKMLQDQIDAFVVDNDFEEEDLTITDENGFAIASFRDGEFRTKNFDSSKVKVESGETSEDDFDIRDENDFIIVQFNGGHIKTKNFDSSLVGRSHWYGKSWYGFGTSITDTSTVGKYPPYLAQISGLVFTNHGNGGSGITSFSDEELYDDIMTADLSGADLITLEVGANDGQAPLGTIYDGLPDSEVQDNSTFCGALNLCIRRLQKDSNAQIVVMCSPSGRYQRTDPTNIYDGDETSGPDNHTILDRNEAIRKVCMLNSCWFIPAGAMDGFGYARMNASNDLNTDNVHHTNLGGYNFAQAIWAFLKNIPLFYTSI